MNKFFNFVCPLMNLPTVIYDIRGFSVDENSYFYQCTKEKSF